MIHNVIKRITLLIISLMPVLLFSGCGVSYLLPYYMGPYSGRVVDIDTGNPIEGAVINVIYSSSSASPAGMLSKKIDAQETLTNADGEFVIPEVAVSGSKYSGHPRDDLSVFKPGYRAYPSGVGRIELYYPDDKQWREWGKPHRRGSRPEVERNRYTVFHLQKLKTIKERKRNMPSPSSFIPPEKQRLLILAINEESRNVGYMSMYPIPKEKEQ